MIDDTTTLTLPDELDVPEDTPKRKPAAQRSRHFNRIPRLPAQHAVVERGPVVRQPPTIAWMQHPTRPPTRRTP